MKDFIIKNIDILMEEKRFIHNLMIALLSGMAGIVFGLISKKLILDLGINNINSNRIIYFNSFNSIKK